MGMADLEGACKFKTAWVGEMLHTDLLEEV